MADTIKVDDQARAASQQFLTILHNQLPQTVQQFRRALMCCPTRRTGTARRRFSSGPTSGRRSRPSSRRWSRMLQELQQAVDKILTNITQAPVAEFPRIFQGRCGRDTGVSPAPTRKMSRQLGIAMRLWKRADPPGDGGGDVPGYLDLVPVGQGGFGVVYRARQERLGRIVAVKVLAAATVDARRWPGSSVECELTGRLTGHPNVVTVLDTGMTRSGRPFVVTEYFEHGSLKQRLDERGPLPVDEVLRIGVKIAGALATAHEAGILHRDVKPQNILMSRYGEPALADFGVARLLDSGEVSTQGNALTLFHAAPEILEGRPPSPSSDTYALASTMYQLLSGRSPFERASDEGIGAVLGRILREDPPEIPRADVPEQVKALLRTALAKLPEERFRDPLTFAEALQGLQADLGYAVTELPVSREGTAPAAPGAWDSPRSWRTPPPIRSGYTRTRVPPRSCPASP